MDFILQGAGVFIYPLGFCSVVALFIIVERLIALRKSNVAPDNLAAALMAEGAEAVPEGNSSLARIVKFFNENNPGAEELKAYARLEMARLERGMFLLDAAIAAAPLLGLLGTVAGLVSVFSGGDVPSQEAISRGVGLALSTTILGLSISIPAILGNLFLFRRIDNLCALLEICAEHLASRAQKK
ncbi:MAG: MotA/TolQ/ExbB proton channel family protein [Opitutales bacterium]|nr:MotA/TolQ/ExbB proton channel family protein [Opitutales bacterium]